MISIPVMQYSVETARQRPALRLAPLPGSPVAELNELSRHPFPDQVDVPEGRDPLVHRTVQISREFAAGMSLSHGIRQEELVNQYSSILFRRLNTLHDVIVPMIGKVSSEVNAKVEQSLPQTKEIVQISYADLYSNSAFISLLQKYDVGVVHDASTLSGLSARDEQEIGRLLDTGNPVINNMIVDLCAKHPVGWLNTVYENYFVADEQKKINTRFDPVQGFNLLDELIVVYLIAYGLQQRQVVDPGISLSLDEYNTRLAQLVNATGSTVKRSLFILNEKIDAKTVIGYIDNTNNQIYVLESPYQEYITQGGTPEGIFGAILDSSWTMNNTVSSLVSAVANNTQRYENHYNEQLLVIQNSFFDRVRTAFIEVFRDTLVDSTEEVRALFNLGGQLNETTGEITKSNDDTLYAYAIEVSKELVRYTNLGHDVIALVRALIVDVALGHLQFGRILDVMERVTAEKNAIGEQITPREACFFAAAEEIVEMLLSTNTTTTPELIEVED